MLHRVVCLLLVVFLRCVLLVSATCVPRDTRPTNCSSILCINGQCETVLFEGPRGNVEYDRCKCDPYWDGKYYCDYEHDNDDDDNDTQTQQSD